MLLANRYQIIRMLGEGGFGQTFLAEDVQMPSQRICVVKQLKPMATETAVYQVVQERFRREAAILEQLGELHSQIPKLYAYFSYEGQFYLVQEWIEGETLEERVATHGILSESEVRKILIDLLPVLELMHSQGMIHRDIKPENIILRNFDRAPVLIDFGAVRETMGTVFNSRGNPTSSIVIGTPGYMPPEQAAGRPIPSSDLYSLGLTAIYLLTGRMPQSLDSDPRDGEIVWQQFAPGLSPGFAAVLTQMVRSHPRDRFSSAAEVRSTLVPANTPLQPTEVNTAVIGSRPTVQSNMAPSSDQPNLLLAALAGGGLLCAAIATIFFLNRSPASTSAQPSPTPIASASPSPSPSIQASPLPSSQVSSSPITADRPASRSPDPSPITTPTQSAREGDISIPITLTGSPGSQINVYSQPSTQSNSPSYGVPGDRVIVTRQVQVADRSIWYYVRFPSGAEGWVQQSQTSLAGESTNAPEFPRPATIVGQTRGSRVNLHQLPSTGSPVTGYGLVGDRIQVENRENQAPDGRIWYFVRFPSNAAGWIREDFIRGDN